MGEISIEVGMNPGFMNNYPLDSAERILGIGAASGTAHSATEVKP